MTTVTPRSTPAPRLRYVGAKELAGTIVTEGGDRLEVRARRQTRHTNLCALAGRFLVLEVNGSSDPWGRSVEPWERHR